MLINGATWQNVLTDPGVVVAKETKEPEADWHNCRSTSKQLTDGIRVNVLE
jgi:hypothetical protein